MRTKKDEQTPGALLIAQLVAERKRQDLTQHDMSHQCGVSQATIGEFESHMIDPRVSTLERYASVLGFKLALILK